MGIEQTMEFPDMETCLEVRSSVVAQSENVEALCSLYFLIIISNRRFD